MDRLISAYDLQEHFAVMQRYEKCDCNFDDANGNACTQWRCVEAALDDVPTVDAIPVSWLEAIQAMLFANAPRTESGKVDTSSLAWNTAERIDNILIMWENDKAAEGEEIL